jgi:hypothetical protein
MADEYISIQQRTTVERQIFMTAVKLFNLLPFVYAIFFCSAQNVRTDEFTFRISCIMSPRSVFSSS